MSPEKHKARAFLAAIRVVPSITFAAKAAGIHRRSHYFWLEKWPGYKAAFETARLQGIDALEDEVTERAMIGVFRPNVYQGEFVYEQVWDEEKARFVDDKTRPLGVWEKSDMLALARVRAEKPEKYAQRGAVELTGKDGGAIENRITVEFVHTGQPKE
jgi:hypothetical protein